MSIDGSNFASWFRYLLQERPEIHQSLVAELEPVIPGLTAIRTVEYGPTAKLLRIDRKAAGKAFVIALDELSDGQRTLLMLYTIKLALAGNASVLMFDEPDDYVARAEIQPWLAGLNDAVRNAHATLMVISHHPEVIDDLAAERVVRL